MRSKIINDLISLKKPLKEIKEELKKIDWDVDEGDESLMTAEAVKLILHRYLIEEIDSHCLIDWANMVESREDIEFESDSLRDLIFDIANPDLQGKFDHKVAKSWLEKLEKLQGRV